MPYWNRPLLRGMGIGLVLAALLLQFLNRGPSAAEIERWARELGMVYRTEVVTFRDTPVAPPPEVVIVVIPGGFSSEAIARALQLGGVIAESQAFESRARARNLSQSFKAGVYRFEKGLPLDKVIDRLVAGP